VNAISIGSAELRHFLPGDQTTEVRDLSRRMVYRGTIKVFQAKGGSVELVLERVHVRQFNFPTWFERKNFSHMSFLFDAYASRLINGVHIALKSEHGRQICYIYGGGAAIAALVLRNH